MKNILCFLVFILLSTGIGYSQKRTDANLYGHVVNKATGEHIPFYNVVLKGTTIGVATDASGHYFLKNLPEGDFTIVASGVGYKSVEKQVKLISGKSIEVNFEIEEDAIQLDGVVVSANRNEINRKEASTVVNIISPKLFENTNSVSLAQGLNFQPGIRVENSCQNCGFQQVRINGLDGPYSQILIDSRPIFSALAGVYGLEQIPANMIERVEVVRGGGSALFGSSAIAGTINIITKEPNANSVTLSNTTNLIYGLEPDINNTFNASVVSEDYKSGAMIFGSSRQRTQYDYDGDGFTESPKLNNKNVGFRAYYKVSNYSKISLEYHNLGEFRRGGNNLDLAPHESDITEQLEHNINTGGLKYDLFSKTSKHRISIYSSAQKINRASYYGAQQDPNAYGKTTGKTFVAGMQYTWSADELIFMPSELTFGSEYNVDLINDVMLGYNRSVKQEVNIQSAFLQNEWKNEKLSILLGSRIDKHSMLDKPIISPRFNIRYSPKDWVTIRTTFSTGFRAPQAFDEDLHISVLGGGAALIELDPNLKSEQSIGYSGSVDLFKDFGKVRTNLLLEGFYTKLDNIFILQEIGADLEGNTLLEKRNGSGAIVKGITLEGKAVPAEKIQLQFGMTFQESKYNEAQQWSDNLSLTPQRKMFRTPNRYGYLTLNYQVFKPFSISLSGTYTGSMLVQHYAGYVAEDREKVTPEFYDINLKLSYEFKITSSTTLQINGGVQNFLNSYQEDFDKGEFRDSGYIYGPSLPRTFFFGLKVMI